MHPLTFARGTGAAGRRRGVIASDVERGGAKSDEVASTEAGWHRYYATSSPLLQRDLSIFEDDSLAGDPVVAVVGKKREAEILDVGGSMVMRAYMKGVTLTKIEYTNADDSLAGN
jgi:hypothetical protein